MFSSACLLASIVILFYVLKYRVHVHVTYTRTSSRGCITRKTGRHSRTVPVHDIQEPTQARTAIRRSVSRESLNTSAGAENQQTRPVHPESVVWGDQETTPILDIQSALVNLGAKKAQALRAAKKACAEHPDASFDIQFSVALQEVRAA